MARSLLDGADLRALRVAGAGGAAAAVAAALIDTGLLQFDADDAEWEDRDRLIASGPSVTAAASLRLAAAGASADAVISTTRTGGEAMALAFGAAMASGADGGVWRAWCLLDAAAGDDGRVWEIARAAADSTAQFLGVLVAGNDGAALWRACGWTVHQAPAGDPAWILGALDHVVERAPSVLLVADDA